MKGNLRSLHFGRDDKGRFPGPLLRKDLRAPQGALQIPHFVRDDKGSGVDEVGVVRG